MRKKFFVHCELQCVGIAPFPNSSLASPSALSYQIEMTVRCKLIVGWIIRTFSESNKTNKDKKMKNEMKLFSENLCLNNRSHKKADAHIKKKLRFNFDIPSQFCERFFKVDSKMVRLT